MSVTINGNGTITGYDPVPNGSITTAKLADNAVTGPKAGSGIRRLTYGNWVDATGSEVEFTSIAATKEFYIDWDVVGPASNVNIGCLIGDSGGYETGGYHNASGHFYTNGQITDDPAQNKWLSVGDNNNTQHRSGRIQLLNLQDNTWFFQFHQIIDIESNFWFWTGTKSLSGQLDRIKFFPSSGNFDQGKMRYVKVED